MAGLFGLLDIGAGAIAAANAGVGVAGRNIANANTQGYARERVAYESELAAPLVGGVRTNDPTRAEDGLLSRSERDAAGAGGSSGALASALGGLETSLASADGGVSGALATFFGSLAGVGAAPLDDAVRGQAVASASSLVTSINTAARSIAQARTDSDGRVASLAAQATQLAAQIASANKAIATSHDPVLADKRDLAAQQLAAIVGGKARIDPDGQMRFVLSGGAVLVDGGHASQLTTTPDPANGGHLAVSVVDGAHKDDVTAKLDGGTLAGELSFRDGASTSAANRLDQLAYDVATQVNAIHRANAARDGSTGRDLFVQPAAVAGAASTLTMNAAIVADPRLLAAASPGSGPSDNGGISALIALRDQSGAAGGQRTLGDEAISIVADVGAQGRAATDASDLADSRSAALASLRDSLSGVSTEDELAALNKLQAASQAATKFIATVDALLSDLIAKL